jgi:hypothetical protein
VERLDVQRAFALDEHFRQLATLAVVRQVGCREILSSFARLDVSPQSNVYWWYELHDPCHL